MNRLTHKLVFIVCIAFTLAHAEEKINGRGSKTGPAISVRALKRLYFEDNLRSTPAGGIVNPPTFAFLRSGETNNSLQVYFILTGTAELETDYTRIVVEEREGPAITNGEVQSVTFAPGQRIQHAHFKIIADGVRERAEFIRVKIPEPLQNGFAPPEYHLGARTCATIWISNQKRCEKVVPTPGGGVACVERRSVLPRAYFKAPRCVEKPEKPLPFPTIE